MKYLIFFLSLILLYSCDITKRLNVSNFEQYVESKNLDTITAVDTFLYSSMESVEPLTLDTIVSFRNGNTMTYKTNNSVLIIEIDNSNPWPVARIKGSYTPPPVKVEHLVVTKKETDLKAMLELFTRYLTEEGVKALFEKP